MLRSALTLPFGRPFDPSSGTEPRAYVDSIWGFHLAPAADGRTRLVVRTRSRSRPRLLTRPMDVLFWELRDLQLRVRAEQQTPEWKRRYAVRSGVEGTVTSSPMATACGAAATEGGERLTSSTS